MSLTPKPTKKEPGYNSLISNAWNSYSNFINRIFGSESNNQIPDNPKHGDVLEGSDGVPLIYDGNIKQWTYKNAENKEPEISATSPSKPVVNTAPIKNATKYAFKAPVVESTTDMEFPNKEVIGTPEYPYGKPFDNTKENIIDPNATGLVSKMAPYLAFPEKESAEQEGASVIDTAVKDYEKQLDDVNKKANLVDAAKLTGNLASVISALTFNDPTDLQAPVVKAPKFTSAGQYLRASMQADVDKQVNTANRVLSEQGRADAIVGNTANAMDELNKVNLEAVKTDIDTANQQAQADIAADNQNSLSKLDAYNKNIERQLHYNMLKGQTLTQAFNALGEQGTQYANRLGQTAYAKWMAKLTAEEAKLMQVYAFKKNLSSDNN